MTTFAKHIHKSRFIVAVSVLLFFLGISAIVFISSSYTDSMIKHASNEVEHDLNFLCNMVKKAYLKKDFTGVEHILNNWVADNNLDYRVHAVSANGFELFSYSRSGPIVHSKLIEKNILHNGNLLATISLERDLSDVVSESTRLRSLHFVTGISFAVVFGLIIWFLLHRFAFKPLENEIFHRNRAEEELWKANDELENRVEERTAAIKQLSSVVEQTDDIVVITDQQGIVEYVNPSFKRITGYSSDEVTGKKTSLIKSGLHDAEFYQRLWDVISTGQPFREVFINRRKDGNIYYEEKTISPLKDSNGNIQHFVSTGKDISDRIETQEKLHHLATHDTLTNLPNKMMIIDRMSHAIEQAKRSGLKVAILFLDLDRFKHVNDSLGHPTGDSLLKTVAMRLNSCMRHGDTVGRFGGDEFTVVMEGLKHIGDINVVAQKVLDAVSDPTIIDSYEIMTSASIGISIFPDDCLDANTLLKNADVAMYRAKAKAGNTYQYYTHDMSVAAIARMELQHRLNHALERQEFKLHYQARLNTITGKITGMEALLRWENPDIGNVEPGKFIPILEETGNIVKVGHWVLEQACKFNSSLISRGLPPLRVSVNLSARQFHDENLLQHLDKIYSQCKLDSRHLEIEITESLLIDNVDKAISILEGLHRMGITVSIDDFGTGYSSLSYLKRFPIDALKIDQSFVQDIPEDQDDVAIVHAIQALGNNLDLKLVVEGIETEQQFNFFRKLGFHELQGYYIHKPMDGDEFTSYVMNHKTQSLAAAGNLAAFTKK